MRFWNRVHQVERLESQIIKQNGASKPNVINRIWLMSHIPERKEPQFLGYYMHTLYINNSETYLLVMVAVPKAEVTELSYTSPGSCQIRVCHTSGTLPIIFLRVGTMLFVPTQLIMLFQWQSKVVYQVDPLLTHFCIIFIYC